jgi:hypothetical protein
VSAGRGAPSFKPSNVVGNRGGGGVTGQPRGRMDVFSPDQEARAEMLLQMSREGMAIDREWAEMTRAGYVRTNESVFAERSQRWRKR